MAGRQTILFAVGWVDFGLAVLGTALCLSRVRRSQWAWLLAAGFALPGLVFGILFLGALGIHPLAVAWPAILKSGLGTACSLAGQLALVSGTTGLLVEIRQKHDGGA